MRNSTRLLTLLTLVIASLFLFGTVYAGNDDPTRTGFVDLDGDGFNDNMKDSDDDGIPNVVDEDKGLAQGEGTANKGETANMYSNKHAYEYAEQLQLVHEIKHELFEERKGEFMGEVDEEHGSWGGAGEDNLNPEWSDESGPTQDVGHKGEGGK
ncbi:MAG: hypothetical protein JSU74_04665 [Candidatus Zixiibacteriota bacterium]|nr:MAG: hypothetical protein JSU74_04665 [candidate division Zixibacteria bacterium]